VAAAHTTEIVPVRVASGSFEDDLRAVRVVWKRELIRFARNRLRIATSLAQPVLFLFVLGTGLSRLIHGGAGFDFRTFMFPGVVAMTILFTAIFSAVSIVWDRESTTTATLQHWPARLVPAPRPRMGAPKARQMSTVVMTSSASRGRTTPMGTWR